MGILPKEMCLSPERMAVGKKKIFEKGVILHILKWIFPAAIKFTAKSYWKYGTVERFTVNYPYFELGTSKYLIVIEKVLSLGKMCINLALSHFKNNHSLVIIQLCVPAIFSPIVSSTLNFCWHQKRGCLSAGCCSLLVFAGIKIVPITWGCRVFLEPASLSGFHSVWSGWKGTKQSRASAWPPPGVTWLSPTPANPEKLPWCRQPCLQELSLALTLEACG